MPEELFKAIIIQVNLQSIHLVISHNLHIILKERKRNKLSTAIYHKATHSVVRKVTQSTFRKLMIFALFRNLKQRTGSPIYPYAFGSSQQDTIGNFHRIAFFAQLLICTNGKNNITGSAFALYYLRFVTEHRFTVIGQHTGNAQ